MAKGSKTGLTLEATLPRSSRSFGSALARTSRRLREHPEIVGVLALLCPVKKFRSAEDALLAVAIPDWLDHIQTFYLTEEQQLLELVSDSVVNALDVMLVRAADLLLVAHEQARGTALVSSRSLKDVLPEVLRALKPHLDFPDAPKPPTTPSKPTPMPAPAPEPINRERFTHFVKLPSSTAIFHRDTGLTWQRDPIGEFEWHEARRVHWLDEGWRHGSRR